MKKALFLFILAFGVQLSQAQIKKYKPKSYKDSFLEWLEVGVAGFQGKISDKQYAGSRYSDYQGVSFDVKLKFKNKLFIFGTYKHGLPGYDRGFLEYGLGNENYLTRYQMSEMLGGFGFNVIGHHKSRFAFAPIAPCIGIMNYDVKINIIKEIPTQYIDETFTGSNFGIGNVSTMHFRTGKVNIYAMLHVFSSLNNSQKFGIVQVGFEPKHYEPEYFLYTFHFGLRFRI